MLFFLHSFTKWKLKATTNITQEQGYSSLQNELTFVKRNYLNFHLGVSSVRWKKWSTKIDIRYNKNQQLIENRNFSLTNIRFTSTINYAIDHWNFKLNYHHQFQYTAITNNHFAILTTSIIYDTKSNWKFFLDGNNLLNLNGTTQIDLSFYPNLEQFTTFNTFTGQIMIGAGYYF